MSLKEQDKVEDTEEEEDTFQDKEEDVFQNEQMWWWPR